MRDALEQFFQAGTLIRPTDSKPNLVHLVRALATLCGVGDLDASSVTQQLVNIIKPADHLIFILLDGLGMNIIRRLPKGSFLASHFVQEIHATCPSTTACALTSVATAQYPNRHGVTGWFTHLPEFELTAMILPFAERISAQPLTHRGIRVEDVLPTGSIGPILPRMRTHRPMTLVPAYIANTPYNTYSRGGMPGRGYEDLEDAVDQLLAHVNGASAPTYTHLYLHDIDTMCHHVGVAHDGVLPLVLGIDAELARLASGLGGKARIVITADHGLIDVPAPDQTILRDTDPLLDALVVPPTGDARMPVFHLREGKKADFLEIFRQRFADQMTLVSVDDAERLELFGPGPLSITARRRFGDYIAFPHRPVTLGYHPPTKPLGKLYLAVHGGLSPEEMLVPLCIV